MLFSVILIVLYFMLNKYHKGHSVNKFISAGLKRKTDRILYATIVCIGAIFAQKDVPSKPGTLLLLAAIGVAIWDHSQTLHYYAAFSVVFVVFYLIIIMSNDLVDYGFIWVSILIVTVLTLAGLEKEYDGFISQCEHLSLFVAALYFIRKKLKSLN